MGKTINRKRNINRKVKRNKNIRSKRQSTLRKRTHRKETLKIKGGRKRKDFHCYIYDILKMALKRGYTISNIFDFYICMYFINGKRLQMRTELNGEGVFHLVIEILNIYLEFLKSLTSEERDIILKEINELEEDSSSFPKDLYNILQIPNKGELNLEDLVEQLKEHNYLLKTLETSKIVSDFMIYLGILTKNEENISIQSDKYQGFLKKGYVNYCGIRGFFGKRKNRKKKHNEILYNFINPDFKDSIILRFLESLKHDKGFARPSNSALSKRSRMSPSSQATSQLYSKYFFEGNDLKLKKDYERVNSLLKTIFSLTVVPDLVEEGIWVGGNNMGRWK